MRKLVVPCSLMFFLLGDFHRVSEYFDFFPPTHKSVFIVSVLTELSLRFVWVNGKKWVGATI